jgi:hypothetical protein
MLTVITSVLCWRTVITIRPSLQNLALLSSDPGTDQTYNKDIKNELVDQLIGFISYGGFCSFGFCSFS